ncbi:alpha/beta hydrolase [Microbacterium trichothecenolyticum]|uniref:Alpha/beta hydrolase n=1 Tax=Microbacterium ureisolvens TaxID=2781186 RepID=A0ABS7I0Y5_9MICO|nr:MULTISPECIES: alpha/beta hydrolase [Microbacterium]MBW9110462.1 alpha/beta hydrolase [Microbacterium ureisolvens]MBW9120567.1 alpha/beta hydrolase [Microbacterium trichothecenolyticum]
MTRFVLDRPEGRLAVNTYGLADSEPTPLLFIHPVNLRGAAWTRVVCAIAGERFSVVPDLRGFGDSDTASEYDISLWAQDCLDAADEAGVRVFHAIGGSLGGAVATYLAATSPDRIASVLAFGSQLHSPNPDAAAVLSTLEHRSVNDMFTEIIPASALAPNTAQVIIDETLATTNPNTADHVRAVWIAAAGADIRDRVDAVACPVTVATGDLDLTCIPSQGREMARSLGGDYISLPGLGHLPMLEAPDVAVRILREHLARVEAVT